MGELEALEPALRDCPSLPTEGCVYEPGASHSGGSQPGGTAPASSGGEASLRRFVLLELIAQGGFACVFKAYDLHRHQYTACKLHKLSEGWGDARKEAFVRHVEREMEITVGVRHRRCERARGGWAAPGGAGRRHVHARGRVWRATTRARGRVGASGCTRQHARSAIGRGCTRRLLMCAGTPLASLPLGSVHSASTRTTLLVLPAISPGRSLSRYARAPVPRIVDTFAAFEMSGSTVVSVMPFCNGGSLAELLRKQGPLAERDAKSTILQILYGLHYLHTRPQPIIHYDLKVLKHQSSHLVLAEAPPSQLAWTGRGASLAACLDWPRRLPPTRHSEVRRSSPRV